MKKVLTIMLLTGFLLTVGCQENRQLRNATRRRVNDQPTARMTDNIVNNLQEKANSVLHESLSSENGVTRSHAIEVIVETGREDLMPEVIRLTKDDSVGVRFAAAIAVGDMDYTAGALSVRRLLRDANPNAKMAAAYSLTKMGKESLESVIYDQLQSSNQTTRANAALLLGKLEKKDALNKLKWVLNDEGSSYVVKIQATEAIAMIGIDKNTTYQRLWTLLVSKYGDDKISGIRGMRILNTKDSRTAIGTMIADEMPEIRVFAAEQLARLSDFRGKNEVIDYFETIRSKLDSQSKELMDGLGAMAIGRIGGPELEKHLPMLLRSRSKEVQLMAAQAILLLAK